MLQKLEDGGVRETKSSPVSLPAMLPLGRTSLFPYRVAAALPFFSPFSVPLLPNTEPLRDRLLVGQPVEEAEQ